MKKGHNVGWTVRPGPGGIHMPGSIQAQLSQGMDLKDGISGENLRYQKFAGRGRQNILFMIDTSGSTLSDDRFAKVKGCVISLLQNSYTKRVRVAVVSYGGGRARLDLPFTSSAELAAKCIEGLKGGGSTPLIPALGLAGNLLDRLTGEDCSVYLLSDCRYDRSRNGSEIRRIRAFGTFCRSREIPITLIDCSHEGRTARRRAELFASQLGARRFPLEELRVELFTEDEKDSNT